MKSALISGITGQTGSYLAELLLSKGYEVHGIVRRTTSSDKYHRIGHILHHVKVHDGDLLDQGSLEKAMIDSKPDEIYNLAAQSFVGTSWKQPSLTAQTTGIGTLNMLEAMRKICADARFYQASTSELFGEVRETPQVETTPFYPRSPYGAAKAYAHYITVNYRESYNLFASCGIAYNHESPRRGAEFVTRKITRAVAQIANKKASELLLGNLDSKRDWMSAKCAARAMYMMLQHSVAGDYVVGTGETHSVREFVELAFQHVGLDWHEYVKHDTSMIRPTEVDVLLANPAKIKREIGWEPELSFTDLVKWMVDSDMTLCANGKL